MEFNGINGFLGTRASLMLDVVFVAMFLVVPVLAWSIWQVKHRQRYDLHKKVQLALSVTLLAAVGLFEIDMRFISGWRDRAAPSPYSAADTNPDALSSLICTSVLGMTQVPGWTYRSLTIHLFFAITTCLLWVVVTIKALKRFPHPPRPNEHSPSHRFWGQVAAWDMVLTAVTGWIFYWFAFVAK